MDAGELEHVRYVEVEGAEDAQILVDGLGEIDGAFPGADDEVGEAAGDGLGQGTGGSDAEGADEIGTCGANAGDGAGPGEFKSVCVAEHDGTGVRVHELDGPAL